MFADRHPLLCSVLATLAFVVSIVIVAAIGGAIGTPRGLELSGAIGRAVFAALAIALLLRVDRGLISAGTTGAWLQALPVLLFVLVVYPPLFTGSWMPRTSDLALAALVAANGAAAGILEEVVFRGIVLGALLKKFPRSTSILISALLFAVPHALNIFAGSDRLRVSAQLVWATLLGIVFACIVIAGGTVWPAAAVHALANAFMHVNRIGVDIDLTLQRALLLALAPLPLVVHAVVLLRRYQRK